MAGAIVGAGVGLWTLVSNDVDAASVPALAILTLSLLTALSYLRMRAGRWDRPGLILLVASAAAAGVLLVVPQWMYGMNVNGIVHHSVVSIPLLLLVSTAAGARAIQWISGASPSGRDLALYPWLALPVLLALIAYGLLLGDIVITGIGGMSMSILTTAYHTVPSSNGGLAISIGPVGLLNGILGTLLLTAMTLLIAVLPGVGAGVFMNEYPGRLARVVDFCTQMLRAVSMFVIAAAAFGIVKSMNGWDPGSFVSQLVRGSFTDPVSGAPKPENGSFLFAAAVLALLVMPVIAKMTEEGLRSAPRELREGSIALGATDGHALRRILLPWAAPNILTGLVIAAAEANGSLAAILFLEGVGENGVGLTNGVTSLDYSVFATLYGPILYAHTMQKYQLTAALLLLLLTAGLSVAALLLQRRFAKRYRGSMTAN
jgi:ABC-type phosphate transport system permease subunit